MEELPKHLKIDARRGRFEKRRHYGGGGTTFKQSFLYCENREMLLEIDRPENEDFLVMSTEVDELYDLPVNGPHGLATNQLEELLSHLSAESVSHDFFDKSGKQVTIFRLPAIGWKIGKASAAKQKARIDRLQLGVGATWDLRCAQRYIQTKTCKILTQIADAPSESIGDRSLLDRHSLSCSASSMGTRPESARVHNNCSSACWSPPLTNLTTHFLQVDLTGNCEVTYVSTQGRFPPLLRNPYNSICVFSGAQIMDEQHVELRQWVWKYEVVGRVDSGRSWFSLGVFDGNRDMTTEVAHKLLSPVMCRYLRFHILGCDRVPAMRVGVYGLRPGGSTQTKVVEKQMVKYRFERIAQDMCLDRVPVGSSSAIVSHWYNCRLCYSHASGPCNCKHRHRHLRRLAARKTVPEALALLHSTTLPRMSASPFAPAKSSSAAGKPADPLNSELFRLARADAKSVGLSRLSVLDLRRSDCDNEISSEWIII